MITPVIESQRLTLDAVRPTDADEIWGYCQDEELQRYVTVPVPYTREDAAFFAGPHAANAAFGDALCLWAIRDSGAFVGLIELRFEAPGTAVVGFWMGREHRGRGIMTEALSLVAEYALDREGFALERLLWASAEGNTGSAFVARANGFRFTGTTPSSVEIRGQQLDGWNGELGATDSRDRQEGWPL